jgi:hypothetical protein
MEKTYITIYNILHSERVDFLFAYINVLSYLCITIIKEQGMTEKELNEKWGADYDPYNAETEEEVIEFKNDCFDMYEQGGFSERYFSPYEETSCYNGMKFDVIRRATTDDDIDLECLPIWVIKFENGETAYCYPEEITKLEHDRHNV